MGELENGFWPWLSLIWGMNRPKQLRDKSWLIFTTRNTLMHDGLPMTFQKIIIECSHLWRFNPKVIDIWRLVKLWSQMDVTNYFGTYVVNLWRTHGEVTDKSSNMALGADVSIHIVPTCNADCLTGRQGGWRLVGGTYLGLDVAVEGT